MPSALCFLFYFLRGDAPTSSMGGHVNGAIAPAAARVCLSAYKYTCPSPSVFFFLLHYTSIPMQATTAILALSAASIVAAAGVNGTEGGAASNGTAVGGHNGTAGHNGTNGSGEHGSGAHVVSAGVAGVVAAAGVALFL